MKSPSLLSLSLTSCGRWRLYSSVLCDRLPLPSPPPPSFSPSLFTGCTQYNTYVKTHYRGPSPHRHSLPPPQTLITHWVAFAHLLLFQVVTTSLVDCHLTSLTAVTLTTKPPYPLMAFLTVGGLEPLGHKPMSIDPPHLLPPPRPTTVIDTHYMYSISHVTTCTTNYLT